MFRMTLPFFLKPISPVGFPFSGKATSSFWFLRHNPWIYSFKISFTLVFTSSVCQIYIQAHSNTSTALSLARVTHHVTLWITSCPGWCPHVLSLLLSSSSFPECSFRNVGEVKSPSAPKTVVGLHLASSASQSPNLVHHPISSATHLSPRSCLQTTVGSCHSSRTTQIIISRALRFRSLGLELPFPKYCFGFQ